jgi:hypothetical protein
VLSRRPANPCISPLDCAGASLSVHCSRTNMQPTPQTAATATAAPPRLACTRAKKAQGKVRRAPASPCCPLSLQPVHSQLQPASQQGNVKHIVPLLRLSFRQQVKQQGGQACRKVHVWVRTAKHRQMCRSTVQCKQRRAKQPSASYMQLQAAPALCNASIAAAAAAAT